MPETLATLPLESYEQENFAVASTFTGPAGRKGTASVGLSPFNIPDSVELSLEADGSCTFRFGYANREPPRRRLQVATARGAATVLLARHSGKVLAVNIPHADRWFADNSVRFQLSPDPSWYSHIPPQAQLVAARNASLVQKIVQFAFTELRSQVLEALTKFGVQRGRFVDSAKG